MKAQVYIAQNEKEIYESYFSEHFYESSKYHHAYCSKFEDSIQRNEDSILKKKQTQKENRTWRHYFTKSHDNSGRNWNKIYKIDGEDKRYGCTLCPHLRKKLCLHVTLFFFTSGYTNIM